MKFWGYSSLVEVTQSMMMRRVGMHSCRRILIQKVSRYNRKNPTNAQPCNMQATSNRYYMLTMQHIIEKES